MVEVKTQEGIARIEHSHVHAHVGLRPRVRLNVDVLGAEELLGAVAGEVLDRVHELASAVVPPAGISLGILVGEDRSDDLHDALGDVVLRGDQFEGVGLAILLLLADSPDLGVDLFENA